jgi:fermentation-respiration switch protein FrsA (DUF1100 family)
MPDAVLRLLEQKLTFKPSREDHGSLTDIDHERFRFGQEFGLDLDGAFVQNGSASVVLFFHGNKHNLTRFREHYELFQRIGQSFLTFDYPGYGTSSGTPSEAGVYAAARAAYSFVRHELGAAPEKIIVYGCSMGGAVALDLCQQAEIAGLITEATFTNSREMAQHLYPYLPLWPFLPIRFRNDEKIARIRAPLMIIHGQKDPIVPVSMASTLHELSNQRAQLVLLDEANHVNCVTEGALELQRLIQDFIQQHTRTA